MTINAEARALTAKINKQLGEGTIVLGSDIIPAPMITSGSLFLDLILGGGWPGNQWVEIAGRESHGKTAIVLKTIAANQALNPDFTTLWIAGEHYDTDQADALGVDNARMIVVPTQDMTFAYETAISYANERAVDAIVIDSYPALVPPEEESKTMDDVQVALGARVTGKFFRKVGHAMIRSDGERPLTGFFINQFRDKIGGWSPMGTPTTTPGGNAKNYAFYTRITVKRDDWIEEKVPGKNMKVKVGQTIKVTTNKNKQAAPGQVSTVDFYFRDAESFHRGEYDLVKEVLILSLLYDVVTKKGAYFYYGDNRWLGKDDMFSAVRADKELMANIDREVRGIVLHRNEYLADSRVDEANKSGVREVARA